MVITDQAQFEQLVQEVRDQILSESQGVGEVDIVDNLDSIYSLPALKLNDSGDQVVEAPLSLLSAPAEEAAALARAAAYDANTAAESANSAASSANLATDKTNEAISNAQSATQQAESSADKANIAAQNADEATAQVLSGESERVEAENARQAAETERQSAEEERKSAEEARKLAEQSREQAESSRVSAEESRVTAESERVTAESSRIQAETERVQKESERESAESTRQQNETDRQSNEDTRNQQEQTRQTNEEQRVSAESSRETEYTDLKQRADALIDDNEAAIENANTAAENANAAIANMENTYAKKDEIPDVSEFITTSVDNLVNYYRKSETYNQEQINSLIGSITTINFKIVDSLPGTGESNLIYLVPSSKQEEKNVKDEYIWVNGSWELIGSTKIDLSNYYTKDEANSTFALKTELAWDTITGKPVWIGSSKPTYTWSEINEKPTTLAGYGITDAFTKTESDERYVNVAGDTMAGILTVPIIKVSYGADTKIIINNTDGEKHSKIDFTESDVSYGYLLMNASAFDINCPNNLVRVGGNKVWHEGNDGSGSGLDADLLDGTHKGNIGGGIPTIIKYPSGDSQFGSDDTNVYLKNILGYMYENYKGNANDTLLIGIGHPNSRGTMLTHLYSNESINSEGLPRYSSCLYLPLGATRPYYFGTNDYVYFQERIAFTTSNVASATKLQTPRTIWGQSFDGTGNVIGDMYNVGGINASGIIKTAVDGAAYYFGVNGHYIGSNSDTERKDFYIWGIGEYDLKIGTNEVERIRVTKNGNVGFSTTSPQYKVDVTGDIRATGNIIGTVSSDIQLKTILNTIDYQDKLLSLGDVVEYEYNEIAFDRSNSSTLQHRTYTGLIYQNVKDVLPSMAYEDQDGYGCLNYLSYDYINLIAGALQQTITKQKQLEKRISILEEENINLKQQLSN